MNSQLIVLNGHLTLLKKQIPQVLLVNDSNDLIP